MSIAEILKWAVSKFRPTAGYRQGESKKNINSAIFDAEILLSFVLKKPREYLYTYPEKKITKKQISKFRFLISQRVKGKPVPYLTHSQEFFGLDFYVDKNVLIPRPETETLVEEVLKLLTIGHRPSAISHKPSAICHSLYAIYDIGTGSGCLAIALAKNLPNAKIIATDISKNALKVAKKNAKKHHVLKQIKFLQGDLLASLRGGRYCGRRSNPVLLNNNSGLPRPDDYIGSRNDNQKQCHCEEAATADDEAIPNSNCKTITNYEKTKIIIANLPYLTKKQLKNVPFEPQKALYGGKDGLEYYKKLIKQIHQFISRDRSRPVPTKTNIILFLEISPEQTKPLISMIKKYLPNKKISFIKDLSGKNRVVKIE